MPTSKPRITITLTERQHKLLEAMAEVQEVSMSSIVVELLETAEPVLERVLDMLEAAKKAPQAALDELKRSLDFAQGHVTGLQTAALGQFDLLISQVEGSQVEGAPASGARTEEHVERRRSPKPTTNIGPHPTNRGVRIPTTPKIPTASKPLKGVLEVPQGCTCKHTKHERMENKACPIHSPAKRRRHAV